jgi:Ca2+-binding EF-hand superfamily protein
MNKFRNKDEKLDRDEFTLYLHPGSHEEMREVTALEVLEDLDKDKDGYLNIEEYIGDLIKDLDIKEGRLKTFVT